jgi:hypothetical protein
VLTLERWTSAVAPIAQQLSSNAGPQDRPKHVKQFMKLDEATRVMLDHSASDETKRRAATPVLDAVRFFARGVPAEHDITIAVGRLMAMPALHEAAALAVRWSNHRALSVLRREAVKILVHYGTSIPETYSNSLRTVFMDRESPHVNCLWCDDDAFNALYHRMTATDPSPFDITRVLAMTYPAQASDQNYPLRLDSNNDPDRRVIALRDSFMDGTACHELFHWLTHQGYEDAAASHRSAVEPYRTMIEGVTEYLTRPLWPARTNYDEYREHVRLAIALRVTSHDGLLRAYFRGENADSTVRALKEYVADLRTRQERETIIRTGRQMADTLTLMDKWKLRAKAPAPTFAAELVAYIRSVVSRGPDGWDQLQRDHKIDHASLALLKSKVR